MPSSGGDNTVLYLILTGLAWLAVFGAALVIFLRWGKRDRSGRS